MYFDFAKTKNTTVKILRNDAQESDVYELFYTNEVYNMCRYITKVITNKIIRATLLLYF